MNLNIKKGILATGFFFISVLAMDAQTLDKARALILKKNYSEAVVAFDKLINQYKSRPDVNKWYGEALYYTGNSHKALPYLEFASKRKITGAYPILAKIYEENYRFSEAANLLNSYKTTLKNKTSQIEAIEKQIEHLNFNENQLSRVEKVTIIDSVILDKKDFFNYYKLSSENGRLLSFDSIYQKDSFKGNVIFQTQRGDRRIFGSKTSNQGMDLFQSDKLHGQVWSEPLPFPENINTSSDEDFPYMLNDGITLYFASNLEPSIGGYDLYITKYNVESGSYFTPERLSMPFNSPYNDFMLAIDEDKQVGWFASDRFQEEGKVVVYLFIPNTDEKSYYKDLPEQEIRNFARINDIRATWQPGSNYDDLLFSVYNQTIKEEKQKREFTFVINDKTVYSQYTDFESASARETFSQAKSMESKLQQDLLSLDALRMQWTKASKNERAKMREKILHLELQTEQMTEQVKRTYIQARNEEISFLRNNPS